MDALQNIEILEPGSKVRVHLAEGREQWLPAALRNMSTAPPVHIPTSRKVAFAGWDSEEEGKRSARGIEFRRKLKEARKKEKMAAAARKAANLDLANRTFQALILPANLGFLVNLARQSQGYYVSFLLMFSLFYEHLNRARLLRNDNDRPSTITMLRRIARGGISFEDIRPNHILRETLQVIGGLNGFQEVLARREGHVSSSSDEETVGEYGGGQDQAQGGGHDQVQGDVQGETQGAGRQGQAQGVGLRTRSQMAQVQQRRQEAQGGGEGEEQGIERRTRRRRGEHQQLGRSVRRRRH